MASSSQDQEGIRLEARRSEERDGLLNGDEKNPDTSDFDVEARAGVAQSQTESGSSSEKPVEYSVSPNVKFGWLTTYFFFSLILTLYNKLVLGVVRLGTPPPAFASLVGSCALTRHLVPFPMAPHSPPCHLRLSRLLWSVADGLLHHVPPRQAREPHPARLQLALHH